MAKKVKSNLRHKGGERSCIIIVSVMKVSFP